MTKVTILFLSFFVFGCNSKQEKADVISEIKADLAKPIVTDII